MVDIKTVKVASRFYPFVVGGLLGVLQTGLFFQLSFTLSSGFGTYLMVTLSWLFGGLLGISIISYTRLNILQVMVLSLLAYGTCAVLLLAFPFNTALWWVYSLLVVGVGVFPGVFFVRSAPYYLTQRLFLWENNGFTLGMVGGTVLFLLIGRPVLWIAPPVLGLIVAFAQRGQKQEVVSAQNTPLSR